MKCPCCGYEPEEESEPLWPDDTFVPKVTLVGGANLDALVDSRVTVDFDAHGWPVRADYTMPLDEARVGPITVKIGSTVDPSRKGGSW